MAPDAVRQYEQNFLTMPHPRISVETVWETELTSEALTTFLDSCERKPRSIGLSPAYTLAERGRLTCLAVAVGPRVLLIRLRTGAKASGKVAAARAMLKEVLLCNPDNLLFAFDMHILALALYSDMRSPIANAIDIQSACTCEEAREVANAVAFAVSATQHPNILRANIIAAFSKEAFIWEERKPTALAFRAWLSGFLPSVSDMEVRFYGTQKINTDVMPETVCG
jgi:hypothetical protein